MGFHKRHINIEIVKKYLNEGDLDSLFNADAFFFNDEISYIVYILHSENSNENDIKLKIYNYEQHSKTIRV